MKWLKRLFLVFLVCGSSIEEIAVAANPAELRIRPLDTNVALSILGDARFDYRIQTSTNLVNWTNLPSFGTLLADPTTPRARSLSRTNPGPHFYRAAQTDGLFDRTLLRTISLGFRQADWQAQLINGRFTGIDVPCTLQLDNGA